MVLSKETLTEISGLQKPAYIRKWLEGEKVPYLLGADGWPRVLESIMVERLGGKVTSKHPKEPQLRLRHG